MMKILGRNNEVKEKIKIVTAQPYALATTIGRKKTINEDCIGMVKLTDTEYIFAIADGHWGYEAAERIISEIEVLKKSKEINKVTLLNVLLATEQWLNQHFGFSGIDENKDFTPETAVILIHLKKNQVQIMSYGDCLAYRVSQGKIKLLIEPMHTWLGVFSALGLRGREKVDNNCQYLNLVLNPGDSILLCTDGVVETIYEKKTVSKTELLKLMEIKQPVKVIAQNIIENSINKGGEDNASCIVIQSK